MIVWDMECKAIRCHWSHDISGLHLQPPEDPAVFTVSQGSFATAPVPPQFAVDAAGGQWRRSNRGGRQGWSHGDLRLEIELICFLTCQRQIQTWCIMYSNLVWITPNRSMSAIDIVSAKPWTLLLRKCGGYKHHASIIVIAVSKSQCIRRWNWFCQALSVVNWCQVMNDVWKSAGNVVAEPQMLGWWNLRSRVPWLKTD